MTPAMDFPANQNWHSFWIGFLQEDSCAAFIRQCSHFAHQLNVLQIHWEFSIEEHWVKFSWISLHVLPASLMCLCSTIQNVKCKKTVACLCVPCDESSWKEPGNKTIQTPTKPEWWTVFHLLCCVALCFEFLFNFDSWVLHSSHSVSKSLICPT